MAQTDKKDGNTFMKNHWKFSLGLQKGGKFPENVGNSPGLLRILQGFLESFRKCITTLQRY